MKAPNLPSLMLSLPAPQTGQRRGSRPGAVIREKMPPELRVEGGQHLADRQLLGAVDRGREIPPEIAQHLLPIDASAGHVVELVFEVGGEIVLDIALEKARQKGGDEPPAVLRHKAPFFEPDIGAVLQDLQDRCISRRTADAELFELLDEARLGVARRRLREVLVRRDLRRARAVRPCRIAGSRVPSPSSSAVSSRSSW